MSEITNELIYEVLKNIQKRLDKHDHQFADLQRGMLQLREDVHSLRGDRIHYDKYFADIEARLDRVEKRLDLVDN